MTIHDITSLLEEWAPLEYAEDFDNVGLLVGEPQKKATGILITLDTLENVVDEAIKTQCNLIVSFHPIIFNGLKKITGKNYVERVIIKALSHDIAIYSLHTALDNSPHGVNAKICEVLGLQEPKILIPKSGTIKKLVTYVPKNHFEKLRSVLFEARAGSIGKYRNCSFSSEGIGSFEASESANPTLGEVGKMHYEEEMQLNVIFASHYEQAVLQALFTTHPYEEVAYEVTTLDNQNQQLGMGMIGHFAEPIDEKAFLQKLKDSMKTPMVRHSKLLGKSIKKVAVLGGSGAFAINAAKRMGADAFVTADLKYHQFYEAEEKLLLCDIGHFESEQFTKKLLYDFLTEKIPNFAIALSKSVTNPIKYF